MRIAHVASEIAPYSQTGGLAQVAAALPDALARLDKGEHDVAVFTPLYRSVRSVLASRGEMLGESTCELLLKFDGRQHAVCFRTLSLPSGLKVHFLDCPELFDREGIYSGSEGDYADNAERFSMLCQASLQGCMLLLGGPPDVFHCHDWPTGLLPILLRSHFRDSMPKTRTVFTIHNLAYQGVFPKELMVDLTLPWSAFTLHGMEFYDQVSTLKAGAAFADVTTTVSKSYAEEIRTPAFGCALDGFLEHDCPRLIGIRNGIDVEAWDPSRDSYIARHFRAGDLRGKAKCREALLAECELAAEPGDLVVGVVSRLASQKGLDLVADLVPELHGMGVRMILVGDGDPQLEDRFRWLEQTFRHHLSVHIGFDVALSHRVFAGADALLMPSRFEPCGLGQMAAMRYGTVPIVHAVGGLRDTVEDVGTASLRSSNGFRFENAEVASLRQAMQRAASLHRDDATGWRALMTRGMTTDWSWSQSARDYLALYRGL